jgi:hypothetical protein
MNRQNRGDPGQPVYEYTSRPDGWYCPRVLSKWQVEGENEVRGMIVTGGDYYEMSKFYFFTVVEVSVKGRRRLPARTQKARSGRHRERRRWQWAAPVPLHRRVGNPDRPAPCPV